MPRAGGVDLEVGGGVGAAHHVPGHAGVHALVLRGHGLDVVNIREARAARRLEAGTSEALSFVAVSESHCVDSLLINNSGLGGER